MLAIAAALLQALATDRFSTPSPDDRGTGEQASQAPRPPGDQHEHNNQNDGGARQAAQAPPTGATHNTTQRPHTSEMKTRPTTQPDVHVHEPNRDKEHVTIARKERPMRDGGGLTSPGCWAWACATVNYKDEELFATSAIAAERRLSELNAEDVANTAWAFALMNFCDEKPFAAWASAAQRRLNEFNSQSVANTAWAFAMANYQDENYSLPCRE